MATTLHVTPWEFSAIRKNAYDLTEQEFISWMLEKWPFLRNYRDPVTGVFEEIKVVVDWTAEESPSATPSYVLSLRSLNKGDDDVDHQDRKR